MTLQFDDVTVKTINSIFRGKRTHEVTGQKREVSFMEALLRDDAMLRQISEGVRIDQVPEDSLMNSKNEWNYFRVPRAVVARDHDK